MFHELVSKALAYFSCLSTLGMFATAMAIAAVNVGKPPVIACSMPACVAAPGVLTVKVATLKQVKVL